MRINRSILAKMKTYFIQRLGVHQHNTGWLRGGICPSCQERGKFGVDLNKGRSNCFKCAYRPRPLYLVGKLEGLETLPEIYKFLGAFEEAELMNEGLEDPLFTKETSLPESFTLIGLGNDYCSKLAQKYLKRRGYNITDLMMKGVGYCTEGKYAMRIIFPYYSKGKLVYFNAREFVNTGFRHLNPNTEEFGIGKNMVTYNIDALWVYKRIYIAESVTNSLTMGDNAIGIGGKIISEYQISNVLRAPCKEVVILLDPDAYWEALRIGLRLVSHKKVKVVKLPRVKSKKDPDKYLDVNDLGRAKVLKFIKAMDWQNYNAIFKEFIKTPKPLHHLPEA